MSSGMNCKLERLVRWVRQQDAVDAEHKLREEVIDFVRRHDGEESTDELKFILEETQWW